MFRTLWSVALGILVTAVVTAQGAESRDKPKGEPEVKAETPGKSAGPLNVKLPTMGGKQFWTDEFLFGEWRIQRNVVTGHCRLLDDRNVRQAWGTSAHCHAEFRRLRDRLELTAPGKRVVILLHGLIRTRTSMNRLARYLKRHGDLTVLSASYASTRASIADHAVALARIVDGLEDVEEINFVAHSMGNIVIRHYLGDLDREHDGLVDPRIRRVVMLAPPNQGTILAQRFSGNQLFQLIWGRGGMQLSRGWDDLHQRLAVPSCEFGVVAGRRGDNPLIPGPDDLVVSVAETRLPGAHDFIVEDVMHSSIMNTPAVQEKVLRFLNHGYFVSEQKRQPIPAQSLSPAEGESAGPTPDSDSPPSTDCPPRGSADSESPRR